MIDAILVEGLRFAYDPLSPDAAAPWVIDGLDLRVRHGEWLAVMGASDVGKTTLSLLLAGLAPHITGGRLEGRVVVAGHDMQQYPPPALAGTVGVLFQEPEAQLFNPTVETEVAWGLENLGLPVKDIERRVDEALAIHHLEPVRHRAPGSLSGGEKKRLALASVLAMRPSVLILDEPMGGLDPVGRRQLLDALSDLRGQEGVGQPVTIVMTESDPEAVVAFADRLVVLRHPDSLLAEQVPVQNGNRPASGQIALEGTPRTLFQHADVLAALGVPVPQMARLAAMLNERLSTSFEFATVGEARATLREYLV
jgi:energy-coupling factor transporter ATP-binding protein EcfA2